MRGWIFIFLYIFPACSGIFVNSETKNEVPITAGDPPKESWVESEYYNRKPAAVSPEIKEPEMAQRARITRHDFLDTSSNEASLWASDGQTNYYFTKNKIRGMGDIVTVNVEQDFLNDTYTELKKALSPAEIQLELTDAQERLKSKSPGESAAASRKPAASKEEAKSEEETKSEPRRAVIEDIDVSPRVELKVGDTMMAEIIDRFPNGNYKIQGNKGIRYRGNTRALQFTGIVKGTDISEEDTLVTGKLYEYRIKVATQ